MIKRRHFSRQVADDKRMNDDQYKELEMMWASKQKKNKILVSMVDGEEKKRNKGLANIGIE